MRPAERNERGQHLDQIRRELNEALSFSASTTRQGRTRRHDDFGPSYGFASLGDFYGQNHEGFWLWHKRRKAG